MKKIKIILLAMALCLTATAPSFANNLEATTATVTAGGITRTVTMVMANWNDPHFQLIPVLANGRIRSTDTLSGMAQGVGAVAAINGGYFNSYTDNEPQGTLEVNGQYLTTLGATLMGITVDNHLKFVPGSGCSIIGTVDGLSDWKHNFYAWGFNYNYGDSPDQIVIFTPPYGDYTGMQDGTCVVVKQGHVAYTRQGNTYIPADGYVIYFGANAAKQYIDRFTTGSEVQYDVKFQGANGDVDWTGVQSALSAGPMLVQNGQVVVNPQAEKFTDPKVTKASSLRSFIGVTADNQLVMGTVPGVTVYQLAPILQKLGLTDAMCLDNASSSGLFYNGKYLVTPGRELNNCLALVYYDRPVPKLRVNGKYIFTPQSPIIENGSTLVPLRGLFEYLGATVNWDSATQSVSLKGTGMEIKLAVGKSSASVNGVQKSLTISPELINGNVFVPVRFVAEALGKTVSWDPETWAVIIN